MRKITASILTAAALVGGMTSTASAAISSPVAVDAQYRAFKAPVKAKVYLENDRTMPCTTTIRQGDFVKSWKGMNNTTVNARYRTDLYETNCGTVGFRYNTVTGKRAAITYTNTGRVDFLHRIKYDLRQSFSGGECVANLRKADRFNIEYSMNVGTRAKGYRNEYYFTPCGVTALTFKGDRIVYMWGELES